MGVTIDQIFRTAYTYAGLVYLEQTGLGPDQTEDCRQAYNSMVDSWRADGTLIHHVKRIVFDLVSSKADYSIGPGGDWDTDRPMRLERIGILLTNQSPQAEIPLQPLTLDEWQNWRLKTQTINWPQFFFYELDFPLGIVHLLYVPTDQNSVALYLEQPLAQIDAVGDELLDFPPNYQELIESNLAVRIAMRHPDRAKLSPEVRGMAMSTMQQARMNNRRPLVRHSDIESRFGRSNVLSGNRYPF
jgi:hypothetical protein